MQLVSYWGACMALSGAVALALLALLAVYARNMRRAPSRFSKGLVVFAGALFLEAAGSMFVWTSLATEYESDVAIPMMALRATELVGVLVLAWVSFE